MVKCGVLFKVQTELLNIIKASINFKGLTNFCGKFLNAASYGKGPETGIENVKNNKWLKRTGL
jgi:hypothetical protein